MNVSFWTSYLADDATDVIVGYFSEFRLFEKLGFYKDGALANVEQGIEEVRRQEWLLFQSQIP